MKLNKEVVDQAASHRIRQFDYGGYTILGQTDMEYHAKSRSISVSYHALDEKGNKCVLNIDIPLTYYNYLVIKNRDGKLKELGI